MIRYKGFAPSITPLALFRQDGVLKAHAAYKLAKAGDQHAALELVLDMAVAWLHEHRNRFAPGLVYVAPHAQEATGDNAIPQTLAAVCAALFQGRVDTGIVQTDRVYHTGADPMERMAARAQFEGAVLADARYVLVDDVTNLGGTLAELNNYIEVLGGSAVDVVVLANAGRAQGLLPEKKFVRLIKERFENEFTEIFGIEPSALTANEASYLVGFKSIDAIRNRLAAAEQEIDRRLRSKGIERTNEATPPGAHGAQGVSAKSAQ